MDHYKTRSICVAAVIAVSLAIVCHELGHILAGRLAGGHPTLLTSTEVKGDFNSLSPAGFVALGVSGSLVNIIFCVLGWLRLRRRTTNAEMQLTAWYFFGVNGLIVFMAMAGECAAGFGDWITILNPFPGRAGLRVLFSLVGFAGVALMVRRSGRALGRLVPSGDARGRAAEGRRIVLIGAAASAILVLGSSVANPIGTMRGMLLALGAGLCPFAILLLGTRFVARTEPEQERTPAPGGWAWLAVSGGLTAVMWFVVGPGVPL